MRPLILTVAITLTLLACSTPGCVAPATLPDATPQAAGESTTAVSTTAVLPAMTSTAAVSTTTGEASADAAAIPTTFDRRAMLADLVDTAILPAHEAVAQTAAALEQAVATLAAEPTTTHLEAAQAAWHSAAAAWARSEVYGLRFAMLASNQVKKWPVNTGFIEEALGAEEPLDEAFVDGSGSNAKGLAAIEYFLFSQAQPNDEIVQGLLAEPRRMDYLVALSQNLTHKANELLDLWSPAGDDRARAFIQADDGKDVQGSISMIANEAIALVETIAREKIDSPLSGVYAQASPEAVESRYAGHSLPLIVANLRGVQGLLDAGLAGYLNFLQGDALLSTAIDNQIEEAIAALDAIDLPLQQAVLDDPDAVREARDAVNALLVLLKVDMANQMSITVTLSDNDGD